MASDEIAEQCLRLVSLLADPHPGLFTWVEARNRVATELRDALTAEPGEGSEAQKLSRQVARYRRGAEAVRSDKEARTGEWLNP